MAGPAEVRWYLRAVALNSTKASCQSGLEMKSGEEREGGSKFERSGLHQFIIVHSQNLLLCDV